MPPRPVAYVLNAFPVISETFILNEIRAMEAAGIPVVILPLSRRSDTIRHATVDALRSPCIAPPRAGIAGGLATLAAHLQVAIRHPRRYAAALRHTGLGSGKRFRTFLLAGRVARAVIEHNAVHLHAHYAKEPLEVAACVHRLTGIRYSFAAHAKDLFTTSPRRLARRLRASRFAVVCHRAGADYLRSHARRGDEMKVMHVAHGIDLDLFRPCEEQREPGLILAVGRLTPKKGFDDLVAACARLRDRGRSFRCVILGRGREEGALRAAVEKAGLRDRVEILTFVPQEELASWYARASIVAIPSKSIPGGNRDGILNVLLEAMACGTPVVATDAGSITEVLTDGRTGLVTPAGDPRAFAAALERLLGDPAGASDLGRAAAVTMRSKDYRTAAVPIISTFRSILSRKTRDKARPSLAKKTA